MNHHQRCLQGNVKNRNEPKTGNAKEPRPKYVIRNKNKFGHYKWVGLLRVCVMRQGMCTLSGAPNITSHTDISHLFISSFEKSSKLMHVNF